MLYNSSAKKAQEYVKKRKLDNNTLKTFFIVPNTTSLESSGKVISKIIKITLCRMLRWLLQ